METSLKPFEAIACRRLCTPRRIVENVVVRFDGARIASMDEQSSSFASCALPPGVFDARDEALTVVPGMIDTHIHGSNGCDFLDRNAECFDCISDSVVRGGATSIVCTTTIPVDDAGLERFGEFVRFLRAARPGGARFLGIFLEGPFLNMDKRGGFGERFVQAVDLKKAERILDLCGDLLLKIMIAPEIEGAEALVRLFLESPRTQVEISLGHTAAGYDLARRCFAMERVRQVTHAFNAMDPFHHRSPNLIGAAMLDPNVFLEIIPDGHHLSGPSIELLYRVKGPSRLVIITDGTAATATAPGTKIRSVGGYTEVRDGAVRLMDGGLAGSNLLMAGALASAQKLGGVPFLDALEMCTLTPAVSVNWEEQIGSIEPGKRADLCVLNKDGSVAATVRDGVLVYAAK